MTPATETLRALEKAFQTFRDTCFAATEYDDRIAMGGDAAWKELQPKRAAMWAVNDTVAALGLRDDIDRLFPNLENKVNRRKWIDLLVFHIQDHIFWSKRDTTGIFNAYDVIFYASVPNWRELQRPIWADYPKTKEDTEGEEWKG